jgi:hypothetical protein
MTRRPCPRESSRTECGTWEGHSMKVWRDRASPAARAYVRVSAIHAQCTRFAEVQPPVALMLPSGTA